MSGHEWSPRSNMSVIRPKRSCLRRAARPESRAVFWTIRQSHGSTPPPFGVHLGRARMALINDSWAMSSASASLLATMAAKRQTASPWRSQSSWTEGASISERDAGISPTISVIASSTSLLTSQKRPSGRAPLTYPNCQGYQPPCRTVPNAA